MLSFQVQYNSCAVIWEIILKILSYDSNIPLFFRSRLTPKVLGRASPCLSHDTILPVAIFTYNIRFLHVSGVVFSCSGCFPTCPLGGGVVQSSLVTATPAAHRHQRAYLRQLQLFSDTAVEPACEDSGQFSRYLYSLFFLRWSAFCFHRSSNHGVVFERPSRIREINLTNK